MSCGCGGGGGGGGNSSVGGPMLTGTLDERYATQPDQPHAVDEAGVAGDIGNFAFGSVGFWIVLAVVIGGTIYIERKKKKGE